MSQCRRTRASTARLALTLGNVVMPDDPAFPHGELDRFLVTRAAARVGR
jgi:hypothetical protein